MAARETEVEKQEAAAPAVEAPAVEVPAAEQQQFTQQGELPAVAEAAPVAAGATASELAFGATEKQNEAQLSSLDTGVHDPYHYKLACEQAGKPEKWKSGYAAGHTEAQGWEQPHDHRRSMEFQLKKGRSASQAVQDFIKGPTIADYRAYGVADEVDEVRSELGDRLFDKLFGSANEQEDKDVPKGQRLVISSALYTTPIGKQMKQIAADYEAKQKSVPEAEQPKAAAVEQRVEEKPKAAAQAEPEMLRQELGLEQQDRQIV